MHKKNSDSQDVKLSKLLSFVLRHGADKLGVNLDKSGFAEVEELLKIKEFKNYSLDDIKRVVETNDKKRFVLESDCGRLRIKACQGHSLKTVELEPYLEEFRPELAVHGKISNRSS